jgi:hypothetical protein
MSSSDVSIVAFGRPECDDAQSRVLLAAAALGASTRLVTSSEDEDFSSMDHGSIDWRDSLDGAHWFVTSASTAIEGEAARFAWGAGMTFGELEGVRTVMIADLPEDHSRLAECWGAVIERIRQIHVLFIDPAALGPISQLEGVNQSDLLHEIRLRGLVPHVCTLDSQREALIEHALGSVRVPVRAPANPYRWLAAFICELPGSGLGHAGVERAARAAGNADSPPV